MGGQRQRDRRDGHLDGDPVGLDVVQHLVDVEAAMQPDPRAGVQRHHDVEQAEDVRRRRHDLHAVGRRQSEGVAPVPRRPRTPVGVPHRLGHAGRAGTEHEQRVRVRGRRFDCRRPGVTGSSSRHRHRAGEHRVIADGVRRLRHRKRVLDFGLPPRRAEQDRAAPRVARWPAGRRRTRAGSTTSAPPGRPRTPRARASSPCRWPGRRAPPGVFALVEGEGGRLAHVSSPALPDVAELAENTLS